jgi:hypothetical protein
VRSLIALLVVSVLVLAACGSPDRQASPTASPEVASLRRCPSLTAADVMHISSARPIRNQDVAPDPGTAERCGTLFIGGSPYGNLIVEITESDGGSAALGRFRSAMAQELGKAAVRPIAGLGSGAFVARRVVAFARAGRVVQLETGYGSEGRLTLTAGQLVQLARLVASRR